MTFKDLDKMRKTLVKQQKKAYKILAELDMEYKERYPNSPWNTSYGIECARRDFDNYVSWIHREIADVEKHLVKEED